jgi:hypothetical protein
LLAGAGGLLAGILIFAGGRARARGVRDEQQDDGVERELTRQRTTCTANRLAAATARFN